MLERWFQGRRKLVALSSQCHYIVRSVDYGRRENHTFIRGCKRKNGIQMHGRALLGDIYNQYGLNTFFPVWIFRPASRR